MKNRLDNIDCAHAVDHLEKITAQGLDVTVGQYEGGRWWAYVTGAPGHGTFFRGTGDNVAAALARLKELLIADRGAF